MKIAIFGAGGITQRAYLPILMAWPGVETVGIYSRTAISVKKVCEKFHIANGTTNAQELIDRNPESAFILTNDQSHFHFAEMLLNAGVDVFVEKPLAQNSDEVKHLAMLAKKKKRILMVGFNRRFAPLYIKAKEIFREKPIQLAVLQKHRPRATHTSLYNNFLDDTIHQIDLLRFLCGDAEPVSTYSEQRNDKLVGAISLSKLKTNGIGVVVTSLNAGAWQENAAIHGGGVSVKVDAFERLYLNGTGTTQIFGKDRQGKWISDLHERGFYGEIEHFFQCVNSRKEPQTNGNEALKTHLLLEKMVILEMGSLGKPPADGWDQIKRWE